jgi:hypothetical protein
VKSSVALNISDRAKISPKSVLTHEEHNPYIKNIETSALFSPIGQKYVSGFSILKHMFKLKQVKMFNTLMLNSYKRAYVNQEPELTNQLSTKLTPEGRECRRSTDTTQTVEKMRRACNDMLEI